MAFTAEISRTNPTCLIFLVDQSKSMDEPFGGQPGKKKSEGVADGINRLLQNLVLKCAKSDGIRDYFHVGVFGYSNEVRPVLSGSNDERPLVPISEVANSPLRVEQRKRFVDDGGGGLIEQVFRFPVWFEPMATGKTSMNAAVTLAKETVEWFIEQFPDCYPPLVINLTDGQPTDANPLAMSQDLKALRSSDGNVLFFNGHLSSSSATPIAFPSEEGDLPDKYARVLFRMSSILPPTLMRAATDEGFVVHGPTRGFVFNADLVAIIRFLEIGTRVATSVR
jgi:hypothetical protein